MQEKTKKTQPSEQAQAITAGLAVAYRKMLEFKQYKGTPVVVSENGKIKHLNPSDLLKSLERTQPKP